MMIYPQITQMNADSKPVEFDQFGTFHPSQFTLQNSKEVLGDGE